MRAVSNSGYVMEPHTAIALEGLTLDGTNDSVGICLATAHPAKFKSSVESVLKQEVAMPDVLNSALQKSCLAEPIRADYAQLKAAIFSKLL